MNMIQFIQFTLEAVGSFSIGCYAGKLYLKGKNYLQNRSKRVRH